MLAPPRPCRAGGNAGHTHSGPASAFEPVGHFYEQVLGVTMGLRSEFESDSFSKMVGTAQTTRIRANNYGLPPGSFDSLHESARLDVMGLDALLARCVAAGVEVRCPAQAVVPWWSRCMASGTGWWNPQCRTERGAPVTCLQPMTVAVRRSTRT